MWRHASTNSISEVTLPKQPKKTHYTIPGEFTQSWHMTAKMEDFGAPGAAQQIPSVVTHGTPVLIGVIRVVRGLAHRLVEDLAFGSGRELKHFILLIYYTCIHLES